MACALSGELTYRLGLNTKSLGFIARPLIVASGTRTNPSRHSNSGLNSVSRSLPLTRWAGLLA